MTNFEDNIKMKNSLKDTMSDGSLKEAKKMCDSTEKGFLLDLEKINFPVGKAVRVRKTMVRGSMERNLRNNKTNIIQISKRGQSLDPAKVALEDAELAIKYVLDKGDDNADMGSYGRFSPQKNTCKLPVSFLKMRMQRNLRQQQSQVDEMKNHFRASRVFYHRERPSRVNNRFNTRGYQTQMTERDTEQSPRNQMLASSLEM